MLTTKQFLIYHNNDILCTGIPEPTISLDSHYLNNLEKKYNIKIVNKLEAIDDTDLYAFDIHAKENGILFTICQGYIENNFNNSISWNTIYSCILFKDAKSPSCEEGYGDFDFWIEQIKDDFGYVIDSTDNLCLNDDYIEEIRKVFPSVIYYKKFSDFVEIYMKKGITSKNKNFDFKNINKGNVNPYVGNKLNSVFCVKYAQLREVEISNEVFFEVCLIKGQVFNGKMEVESKKYAYITKDYVYNLGIDKEDFMDSSLVYSRFYCDKFCRKYPEVMLKEYLNSGGKFILPFILSNNHNSVFELTGKAGLGYIADRIYSEMNFDKSDLNFNGSNVKQIYGLPIKALRTINKYDLHFGTYAVNFDFLKKIYKSQPSIFNLNLTPAIMLFIKNESFADRDFFQKTIKGKRFLNMLRYVDGMSVEQEELYKDYLQMCRFSNLNDIDWTPKELKYSHDVMMTYMNERRESIKSVNFEIAVNADYYKNLVWEKDKYCFLIPRKADDLVMESYQMGNCVRGYVNSVASGYTHIVFLRQRNKKNNSFITIEVDKFGVLRQAKGKANTAINDTMVELVKLWCKEKNINYDDCKDLKPERFQRYF